MYEKQVDDFFIRVENLKNDYVNKYTFISDQTLQIFKDDIKLLLREIFGCNILNYIDVELKRDDYIRLLFYKFILTIYNFVSCSIYKFYIIIDTIRCS